MTKEADIHRACIRRVKQRGGDAEKIAAHSMPPGTPDILACYLGVMIWAEVKKPGGTPELAQTLQMERWSKVGAVCGVVTNTAEMDALLDRAERRINQLMR